MKTYNLKEKVRAQIIQRVEEKKAVLMFGAGIGLTAAAAQKGGADLIGVYSTAVFRMKGLPSLLAWLPYGDVNKDVKAMAKEIVPMVDKTPLIAGVGAHNPAINLDKLLDELADLGFSGVTNEPFCSMFGSYFMNELEKYNIGFSREVELIKTASSKGLYSVAWAMSPEQAVQMAEAGADVIGAMVGVTSGGSTGSGQKMTMEEAISQTHEIVDAAKAVDPHIVVLTHGGPFNDVNSAKYSIEKTGAQGYAAGSSGERIPTEKAVVSITQSYHDIHIG